MTATNMPPPPADRPEWRTRAARRCLAPALLLTLTPKCVLCLLAYAGLGAALGLGGPEICGAPDDPTAHWTTWLSALGLVAFIACLVRAWKTTRLDPGQLANAVSPSTTP